MSNSYRNYFACFIGGAFILKELVENIAKDLVNQPEQVVVREIMEGDNITIQLKVAPEDMGKVIGKQGRIAKAIRVVVKAAAIRKNKKATLEII